jgi:hypothetical protein
MRKRDRRQRPDDDERQDQRDHATPNPASRLSRHVPDCGSGLGGGAGPAGGIILWDGPGHAPAPGQSGPPVLGCASLFVGAPIGELGRHHRVDALPQVEAAAEERLD